jgi:hypothetical protein
MVVLLKAPGQYADKIKRTIKALFIRFYSRNLNYNPNREDCDYELSKYVA